MCVGIPMKVIASDGLTATCEAGGRIETVDLALVGEQPAGVHVLVFLGAARQTLSADEAEIISRALEGLASAMAGHGTGDAFADLENRTPQLPPHLEAARKAGRSQA